MVARILLRQANREAIGGLTVHIVAWQRATDGKRACAAPKVVATLKEEGKPRGGWIFERFGG